MKRKIILYIASSLDGYIAKPDGGLDWLINSENDGDNGLHAFMERIDTTIMGRTTYDEVLGFDVPFPYVGYENYVFTSHPPENDENGVHFINGDIKAFISTLKKTAGKDIFLIGGSQIIAEFLELELVDEIILSIAPVLIGKGIPLFTGNYIEQRYKLDQIRQYNELVQIHYKSLQEEV